jgi:hypothetical protein
MVIVKLMVLIPQLLKKNLPLLKMVKILNLLK